MTNDPVGLISVSVWRYEIRVYMRIESIYLHLGVGRLVGNLLNFSGRDEPYTILK
jgi:hypothetical protein